MKRLICLLSVCALLLTGCGKKAAPTDAAAAPEAQTAAVIGRSYALEQSLPVDLHTLEEGALLSQTGAIWRAAQTPDGRAALYHLKGSSVLVAWDDTVVTFDSWAFDDAPRMALVSEASDALMIALPADGTEVLHLLSRDDHRTVTDFPMPEILYEQALAEQLTLDKKAGTLTCSGVTLTLPASGSYTGTAVPGRNVRYTADTDGRILVQLVLQAAVKGEQEPIPVGRLTAVPVLDRENSCYRLTEILLGQL